MQCFQVLSSVIVTKDYGYYHCVKIDKEDTLRSDGKEILIKTLTYV